MPRIIQLRLAISATLLLLVVFLAHDNAFADSLKADYEFQNTYASSVAGAPVLTDLINPASSCPGPSCNTFVTDTVDSLSRTVLQFPFDNGLQLSPTTSVLTDNGVYTIAILFKFTGMDASHFSRILDVMNGTDDSGLYLDRPGHLLFYPTTSPGSFVVSNDTYVQVVLTHDSAGVLTGYVNGLQQFSTAPGDTSGVIDGNNILRFFQDDISGLGRHDEAFPGSVARIRIFDRALGPNVVAGLETNRGTVGSPTAADSIISGQITTSNGTPLSGATVTLSGTQSRRTITDNNGHYQFDKVETGGFYTVTPSEANYTFNPTNRSFSVNSNNAEAVFSGAETEQTGNPLDTDLYFVRQQYVDFLNREPDAGGLEYWASRLDNCNGDTACLRSTRIGVSAAFFIEQEFQQTGSFVYRLYKGALGRQVNYQEFSADRQQVIGGSNLDTAKAAFADAFVQRPEFMQKYSSALTAESFVEALTQTVHQASDTDLSGERTALIATYNSGSSLNQSRSLTLRQSIEDASFKQAEYNKSFVLMQYFGYLKRNPEESGYQFWLNVLSNGDRNNYRGMVCSFITSTEYQKRFGSVVTHSNAECGQ